MIVVLALFVSPAHARRVDPPVISVVFQQRLVDLSLLAEGDPDDDIHDQQTTAPGNGSFSQLHDGNVAGNLGTTANGVASQESVIEQFRIKGEGQTVASSTGATDASADAGAGSVMFVQFSVAADTTCSLSGEILGSVVGGGTGFGQVDITLSYFKPDGSGAVLSEVADGTVSLDPVRFFHVVEVKGNSQMLLSVTAQSYTGDLGSSTTTATARFSFSLDFGDADEDGLLDDWETEGIDISEDGTVEIDLPAMGADPMKKNLFVELDAMTGAPVDQSAGPGGPVCTERGQGGLSRCAGFHGQQSR
jgi:hypothetical protein